jgi:hypothetical protein
VGAGIGVEVRAKVDVAAGVAVFAALLAKGTLQLIVANTIMETTAIFLSMAIFFVLNL